MSPDTDVDTTFPETDVVTVFPDTDVETVPDTVTKLPEVV